MTSELTDEQAAVMTAPSDSRLLVTAGPGTGKTHTLIARVGHLVEVDDLHPGGILVLSFSRAAVGELRDRLRATGADAGRVAPVTFDSFATRLLSDVDPEGSWVEKSFDGRIQAAIDTIEAIAEFLKPIEHVFVDELQDLVGVRMRFVRALLEEMDVGFTLLGDPAQGIYDFSLASGETVEDDGAPAMYSWLRDRYGDVLTERRLTVNHRSRTPIAIEAAALGPLVEAAPEEAAEELKELLESAPRPPLMAVLRNASTDHRTALLCRNNGEALWLSHALVEEGIDHVLRRGATNRTVAPWVALLIRATGGGEVTRKRFERALESIDHAPDPDEGWTLLRRVARVEKSVDLDRLVRRLREGSVPDEFHAGQLAPIVVSTVHRAKGLEFDRVVLVDGGWRSPYDSEDARTLYVAMTRTIEMLATVQLPEVGGKLEKHRGSERWLHTGWKYWDRRGIEVRPDDVDVRQPPGSLLLDEDPSVVQRRLVEDVRPGDEVVLEFIRPTLGTPAGAHYSVHTSEGDAIGVMSDRFGIDLVSVLKVSNKWDYPRRITGLTLDAVRSVGGDGALTDQAGLGPGGAWLAPAIAGMGQFERNR